MPPSAHLTALLVATGLWGIVAAGCGDNQGRRVVADDGRRNVMVVDDGIDLSVPALKGKVTAAFTVACNAPPTDPTDNLLDAGLGRAGADGGPPDGGGGGGTGGTGGQGGDATAGSDGGDGDVDRALLKAALIAELAQTDDNCHLRPGIDAKTSIGSNHVQHRARWNQALLNDDDPFMVDGLYEALGDDLDALPFHGTATAGTVAFDVPQLNLVLVEESLGTVEELTATFACPTQAAVDLVVEMFSDADVRAAYLARPLATIDRELAELRNTFDVRTVNESFGPITRFGFERLLLRAGCLLINVKEFFRVLNDLDRTYDQAHAESGVLFVRAAGNDGAALHGEAEGAQCRPEDPQQLLVGAYGTDGERSTFTNFGTCVDLYAPGEFVVAPVPGDWLMPLSGTSFAAPMALRLLLFSAPVPFAPATAREALLATREPNGNIPVALFYPAQVFDVNVAARKRQGALSAATGDAASWARWTASRRALRRASWPLAWAARHVPPLQ